MTQSLLRKCMVFPMFFCFCMIFFFLVELSRCEKACVQLRPGMWAMQPTATYRIKGLGHWLLAANALYITASLS